MKFAFDVDGVITDAPNFFKILILSLRNDGHEIHIISDFDEYFRDQRIAELKKAGIEYDYFEITSKKEEYCISKNIDFVIDDEMHEYFPNRFAVPLSILEIKP
ncbi:MAG: hypothetical protein ABJ387_10565 [Balneola sp.]